MGNKRVTRTRYIYSNNIIQLQLNHYVNLPHWDIQGLPSQAPCGAEQLQGEEHVSFLWELMDTLKNYITWSMGTLYKVLFLLWEVCYSHIVYQVPILLYPQIFSQ